MYFYRTITMKSSRKSWYLDVDIGFHDLTTFGIFLLSEPNELTLCVTVLICFAKSLEDVQTIDALLVNVLTMFFLSH